MISLPPLPLSLLSRFFVCLFAWLTVPVYLLACTRSFKCIFWVLKTFSFSIWLGDKQQQQQHQQPNQQTNSKTKRSSSGWRKTLQQLRVLLLLLAERQNWNQNWNWLISVNGAGALIQLAAAGHFLVQRGERIGERERGSERERKQVATFSCCCCCHCLLSISIEYSEWVSEWVSLFECVWRLVLCQCLSSCKVADLKISHSREIYKGWERKILHSRGRKGGSRTLFHWENWWHLLASLLAVSAALKAALALLSGD